jgi:hypothetical protein
MSLCCMSTTSPYNYAWMEFINLIDDTKNLYATMYLVGDLFVHCMVKYNLMMINKMKFLLSTNNKLERTRKNKMINIMHE